MITRYRKLLPAVSIFFIGMAAEAQRAPLTDITEAVNIEYGKLKDSFGANKKILPEFEKQILYALSYFPELRNTRIHFKLRKGNNGIISARPAFGSIFKKSSKRSYIVFIGDSSDGKFSKFLFRNSDANGQVGILGHELTHILNFSRMSSWGLLGVGVNHVSKKYMDNFENKTDSVCIERGFGYQLIAWNIFLRKAFGMADPENGPDPFFGETNRERYMSPASIRRIMGKSPMYNGNSSEIPSKQ
ncbi:MAG: hypothetical protein SFU87_06700 [Chitinophagaceae bacterium]|nr:hypothetical protein [Chitinophagaceae bacterium]